LAFLGLAWLGLAWLGLAWLGLAWLDLVIHLTSSPMKMEQTECSETLAYKIQTQEIYPEENIQYSEHFESLKSRNIIHSGLMELD